MIVQNRLLNTLSSKLHESLSPHLQAVTLERGQCIYEPNQAITDLYFPLSCVISMIITMNDGRTAEAGILGSREMVGINAFLGDKTTQATYIAQIPGDALKIDVNIMIEKTNRNEEMRQILLRYVQVFIAQISQTAACNNLHSVEQRLARWLLEVQDRIQQKNLKLTQEFVAEMLGARRSRVTQTAQKLQEKELIRYHRGNIEILDLPQLEAASCECFRTIKQQYDCLFNQY